MLAMEDSKAAAAAIAFCERIERPEMDLPETDLPEMECLIELAHEAEIEVRVVLAGGLWAFSTPES
jgi:hypothetical protein